MDSKPKILLVTGAWHLPWHYRFLIASFERSGYEVECPRLPTNNKDIPPPHSFQDDCDCIRSAATKLVDAGHRVIAVFHSYGGVVGTNALFGLSTRERAAQGKKGGIDYLVYMAAFILPLNSCLATPFGGGFPPNMEAYDNGTCVMTRTHYVFYDEVADDEIRKGLIAELTLHPTSAQTESLVTHASYRTTPTAYIFCENDRALFPEVQRGMIAAAEGDVVKHDDGQETGGVYGGKVKVLSCEGGHSPFVSVPDRVVECVDELVEDIRSGKF